MGFIGQHITLSPKGATYEASYRHTAALRRGCASGPVRSGTDRRDDQSRALVPLDGQKIFRNYCAACHGENGKGKGPVAGALNHAPPDLTLISQAIIAGQAQSASAHGSREMPIWGPIFHDVEWDQDLGEVRLDNVTRYVESLQQK